MCYIDVPGNMVTDTVAMDKIRLAILTSYNFVMYMTSLLWRK